MVTFTSGPTARSRSLGAHSVIGAGKHRETNTDLSNLNTRASGNLVQIRINKDFYISFTLSVLSSAVYTICDNFLAFSVIMRLTNDFQAWHYLVSSLHTITSLTA
jgi:hypothetical protein